MLYIKSMKSEIRIGKWYDIPKAVDYQVSDTGRVRNKKTGKILRKILQCTGKSDYHRYIVSLGRKLRSQKIHRLVAEALIPNPDNKPYIDHIDGNPLNNCVENLRWVTQKENVNNPNTSWKQEKTQFKKGERLGKEHPRSKPVCQFDLQGNLIKEWETATQASKELRICRTHIIECCKGRYGCKTCGGYMWKYKNPK